MRLQERASAHGLQMIWNICLEHVGIRELVEFLLQVLCRYMELETVSGSEYRLSRAGALCFRVSYQFGTYMSHS